MREWLVVAGGVRRAGGQDRANLELVRYLGNSGRRVNVVANRVDDEVFGFPNTEVHLAPLPFESNMLGEARLARTAWRARRTLPEKTLVLANGGNVTWASIAWMHCVHAAWETRSFRAMPWRAALARIRKAHARGREQRAVSRARLLIANSQRTAFDLRKLLGVPSERIRVVYFGSDAAHRLSERKRTFRIGFMGALGWDGNKGLDTALEALRIASPCLDPRYRLVVAGHGEAKPWRLEAARLGLGARVEFAGFVRNPLEFFSSIDVLLSPVRYEAYGLAVHEALLTGTPVLISDDAGVTERMSRVPEFLIREKEVPRAWADRLVTIVDSLDASRASASVIGEELAQRSWSGMAAEIVAAAENRTEASDNEQ